MTYLIICTDKDIEPHYRQGSQNDRHPDSWLCLVHRLAFADYESVVSHFELVAEGVERRRGVLSLEEKVNKEVEDDIKG